MEGAPAALGSRYFTNECDKKGEYPTSEEVGGPERGSVYRTLSALRGRKLEPPAAAPTPPVIGCSLVEISTAKPGHSTSASNSNSNTLTHESSHPARYLLPCKCAIIFRRP